MIELRLMMLRILCLCHHATPRHAVKLINQKTEYCRHVRRESQDIYIKVRIFLLAPQRSDETSDIYTTGGGEMDLPSRLRRTLKIFISSPRESAGCKLKIHAVLQ